jgi:hypothetical protein
MNHKQPDFIHFEISSQILYLYDFKNTNRELSIINEKIDEIGQAIKSSTIVLVFIKRCITCQFCSKFVSFTENNAF